MLQNWIKQIVKTNLRLIQQQSKRYLTSPSNVQRDLKSFENHLAASFRHSELDGYVRTTPYDDIPNLNLTIPQYIWQHYTKWQNKVAIVCALTGRQYTYAQLRDLSATFAIRLQRKLNLQRGDVIALCLPNIPEFPICTFGALEAGLVITTVNPIYTADEISKQLIDSNATILVGTVSRYPVLRDAIQKSNPAIKLACIKTDKDQAIPAGAIDFFELIDTKGINLSDLKTYDIKPTDLAFLPYSSGTTGLPKGVQLSHQNIVTNCLQIKVPLPFEPLVWQSTPEYQDVCSCILPLYHIYGFTITLAAKIEDGCKLVTLPQFQPDAFLRSIVDHKITLLQLVPPIILFLAGHKGVENKHLQSIRNIIVGAAPIGKTDADRMFKKAPQVTFVQGYGLTESSPAVLTNYLGNAQYDSVGSPVPQTEVKIVNLNDPNLIGLGPNEKGELVFRGPQVMMGYLNNEKANNETITKDKWLRSGDMGYYDENGFIYITDRLKELIKVKGFQVAPAELEAVLRSHPMVSDAGVIGVQHEKDGEVPRAFVVKSPDATISEQELLNFVADKVAPFKRIRGGIKFLEAIPKNPSGKIMRRELKLKYC